MPVTECGREMKDATLERRVKAVVVRQFYIPFEKVRMDASFVEDLGCDALDINEFYSEIQVEFGIAVPMAMRASLKNLQSVLDYLHDCG